MLILSPPVQEIAAELARKQQQFGLEHYWGQDRDGRIYEGRGEPDRVVAPKDLEAAYNDPRAELRYHHSHPDERALSPSDLGLLTRDGVTQVWAHSVGGGSYGATLAERVSKAQFRATLDKLHSHMDVELVQANAPNVTPENFEAFCDLAACELLEIRGLIICHIRLSDAMRRTLLGGFPRHIGIRDYFDSVI